ncbi:MAG: lysozyme inhibitor LprI family protein [Pseudomonadota bacterium]
MLRPLAISALALCASLTVAFAQDELHPCETMGSTVETTNCYGQAHEAADADLNLAYKLAITAAKDVDNYTSDTAPKAAIILRDAQRRWIAYRDEACDAEAAFWGGGTGASAAFLACLERLTRVREQDLRRLFD